MNKSYIVRQSLNLIKESDQFEHLLLLRVVLSQIWEHGFESHGGVKVKSEILKSKYDFFSLYY
jgi:hypothetical protein